MGSIAWVIIAACIAIGYIVFASSLDEEKVGYIPPPPRSERPDPPAFPPPPPSEEHLKVLIIVRKEESK